MYSAPLHALGPGASATQAAVNAGAEAAAKLLEVLGRKIRKP